MVTLTQHPIVHTRSELTCMLRYLRPVRDQLHRRQTTLEEQLKAGADGDELEKKHRAVSSDVLLLDESIRKMWESITTDKPAAALTAIIPDAKLAGNIPDPGLGLSSKEPPS